MRRTIAFTTAIALSTMLGGIPTDAAASDDVVAAELLLEDHFSEQGFEVDLFVTRGADGTILSEATIRDPASTDEIEIWTDGTTVWWDGTAEGEHVEGSATATDLLDPAQPPALFCLHPVAAIICIGGAVVLFGGCVFGFSCEGPTPPNPPDSSGHGEGGGGDSDGSEDDGTDGGSDDDGE